MNSLLRCNNHAKSAFADYRPRCGRDSAARDGLTRTGAVASEASHSPSPGLFRERDRREAPG